MRLFYISLLCGAVVNVASSLNFTDDSWSGIVTGVPFELTWKGNTGAVAITLNNGTTAKPNLVNTIATGINSNSYSWTPGVFAVPGRKFFLTITDSTGAKASGDTFVVAATASSTQTSASTTSTANPKSTASTTSTTASSTQSSSNGPSPTGAKQGGLNEEGQIGVGVGVTMGVLVTFGLVAAAMYAKKKKRRDEAGGANAAETAGATDGASDARPAEKRGFFGFWGRKGGEKGYTGVAQVHELQASDTPAAELDGTVRHELG